MATNQIIVEQRPRVRLEDLLGASLQVCGSSYGSVRDRRRDFATQWARSVYAYLGNHLLGYSLPDLARAYHEGATLEPLKNDTYSHSMILDAKRRAVRILNAHAPESAELLRLCAEALAEAQRRRDAALGAAP